MKRVILSNLQPRLGDSLMMTPVIREFKATYPDISLDVVTARPEIYENNPHVSNINPTDTPGVEVYDLGPGNVSNGSKTNGLHIAESFRLALESKSDYRPKPGHIIPDIHLSEAEKKYPLVTGDYWVIAPSHGTGYTSKQWVLGRWQQVVDSMSHINFVQTGDFQSNEVILKGKNVCTDLIGKTSVRELFQLIFHSKGVISLISAPMHIAGAFFKPCVVIAGGREPKTFEAYESHQFLSNIGCLPCSKNHACWAGNKDSCFVKMHNAGIDLGIDKNVPGFNVRDYAKEHKITTHNPRCMEMIGVDMVKDAVEQYYQGGRLTASKNSTTKAIRKPIFRMVGNAKFLGGAERSMIHIMKMMLAEGYQVEFVARNNFISHQILQALPNSIKTTDTLTSPCDILMLYASDLVFDFHKPEFNIMLKLKAKRKVMALTYKLGKAFDIEWTRGWSKYLFLSTDMEGEFLCKKVGWPEEYIDISTKALPPPVDLTELFKIPPTALNNAILRHSSQGDKKYDNRLLDIIGACPGANFHFMPPPSFLNGAANVKVWPYNGMSVPEFLSKGNLFWYLLPEGYTEQGPRAVMEAMAAGLPVITENRSGMADRVNEETGWFVNYENCAKVINSLSLNEITKKGQAARAFARDNFNPNNWVKEIIGQQNG